MSEKRPEQSTLSAEVKSQEQASAQASQTATKSRPKAAKAPQTRLALLALVLSCVALGLIASAGWYGYKTVWPVLSGHSLANQDWVNQRLAGSQQQLEASVNQAASSIQGQVTDVVEQSARVVSRIDNVSRRLNQLQGADRNDWKLAEAEYLMRLANQRLLTMHDTMSARTLLRQADELLVVVDEYGLFAVRQALAEDLAALRAAHSPDINGTWLELNALAERLDRLPLLNKTPVYQPQNSKPEIAQPEPEPAATADAEGLTLEQVKEQAMAGAETVWEAFSGQFRLRRSADRAAPELLAPEQEQFLRQNLRLMLEQAQVALLQGRTEVYKASLTKAGQWMKRWFINDSNEFKALQQALTRLARVSATQPSPKINRSLLALKAYIDEKASQRLPVQAVDKQSNGGRS